MPPHSYCHQIIRLNGTQQKQGRYKLQICRIGQQGELVGRVQWDFQTLKGLTAFLKLHFPDSEILKQGISESIQFQSEGPHPDTSEDRVLTV